MALRIRDSHGIMHIERTEFNQTPEYQARYDKKYGVGGWKYAEPICPYLSPACGYGPPKTRATCPFCSGSCHRPR
jgi:hypothetical protein